MLALTLNKPIQQGAAKASFLIWAGFKQKSDLGTSQRTFPIEQCLCKAVTSVSLKAAIVVNTIPTPRRKF